MAKIILYHWLQLCQDDNFSKTRIFFSKTHVFLKIQLLIFQKAALFFQNPINPPPTTAPIAIESYCRLATTTLLSKTKLLLSKTQIYYQNPVTYYQKSKYIIKTLITAFSNQDPGSRLLMVGHYSTCTSHSSTFRRYTQAGTTSRMSPLLKQKRQAPQTESLPFQYQTYLLCIFQHALL
ncbi:hypothetical protein [Rossellomorea sp. NS-SX7]|uniref:hypothetical protein n=1 Tax=Rossellomorea sp. NS-SX7 TaxID=3463856 RepID=UPI004058EC8D